MGEIVRMPAHHSRSSPIKDIASLFLEFTGVFFCQNTCLILCLLLEDFIFLYSLMVKMYVCLCT